ncbi:Abhydrolase domain-containing protein mpaH [Lasiodiplodia hormozganensis]|uniref:Abhydrolase domain-containing protein mpaH n=1 Tax=Lasiodiplodia hormozganensis TaxID=869390 RepID=A0AA40D314_9PEZI|nr:Abhydrolase domain-containing protein mpaH [Lasiodiplodia hormozganensis]
MPHFPFHVKEHVLPCQHIRSHARSTAHSQEDLLHLAVKQYIPIDNPNPKPGDVTIIGAHANGFPKELYEPLWEEILQRSRSAGFSIRSIWIADVAHQGASGVLNEHKLGNDPSWFDHPRDLLHMVNTFRDEMIRPIVGVGHSLGGNNLINLSLLHPRLLETLILLDPVVQRRPSKEGNQDPAAASARRRDYWPSREAAAEAFGKNKFYQAWDPRVLDLWVKHGLRDLPTAIYPTPPEPATPVPATAGGAEKASTPGVTLATTKHQEVFTFLRPSFDSLADPQIDPEFPEASAHNRNRHYYPDFSPETVVPNSSFYRAEPVITFHMLPFLRPSVLYIFGETSDLSAPEFRADKMKVTGVGIGGSGGAPEGRVAEITLPGVGHLIPMEAVGKTADHCTNWLSTEVRSWREKEEEERQEWAGVPDYKKRVLSPRVLRMLDNRNGKARTQKL